MKSGVYFVEKQYIEHFLRQCAKSGYYLANSNLFAEEIDSAKYRLRDCEYMSYSIATTGRVGSWGLIPNNQFFKEIYETWNDWNFSEKYKEIYKPNRRKITI